ncbi:MAG: hypothetical protein ABIO16_01950, partial [Nocardioides sp.]
MAITERLPFEGIDALMDQAASSNPVFFTTTEKQEAVLRWARLIARAQAELMRVLAVGDDIAIETGAKSTAHWLADATRDAIGQGRVLERVAHHAGARLGAAMGEGSVNLAQARVIVDALDRLPKDLDPELSDKG